MKKIRNILAGLLLLGGAFGVATVSVQHKAQQTSATIQHQSFDQMTAEACGSGGQRGGGGKQDQCQ